MISTLFSMWLSVWWYIPGMTGDRLNLLKFTMKVKPLSGLVLKAAEHYHQQLRRADLTMAPLEAA